MLFAGLIPVFIFLWTKSNKNENRLTATEAKDNEARKAIDELKKSLNEKVDKDDHERVERHLEKHIEDGQKVITDIAEIKKTCEHLEDDVKEIKDILKKGNGRV